MEGGEGPCNCMVYDRKYQRGMGRATGSTNSVSTLEGGGGMTLESRRNWWP
jgi:hypothetical protein